MYTYTYLVENRNPVIGSVEANGKQKIGVYDYKAGNRRYLEVDKDKVDAFINSRDKKIKKARLLSILATIATVATCTLIGSKIPAKGTLSKDTNKIIGMAVGAASSLIPATLIEPSVDKSITQKFIDENK